MKEIIDNIFRYDDYRAFLKDYYAFMKKRKSYFTLKYFASKAGFGSASFCMYVIDGRRNLSNRSIPKMVKGLELKGKKAQYFENLVLLNQATSLEERERYSSSVEKLRKSTKYHRLKNKQIAYFEEWYHAVVRELVIWGNWKEDYKALGQMLEPPISAEKARKSVELLLEIGLIRKEKNGTYTQVNNALTAEGIPPYVIKKARKDVLLRGMEAAENMSAIQRHISCSTVSLSPVNYKKLDGMLSELHKELANMSGEDEGKATNSVYQVNLQAFPLSSEKQRGRVSDD